MSGSLDPPILIAKETILESFMSMPGELQTETGNALEALSWTANLLNSTHQPPSIHLSLDKFFHIQVSSPPFVPRHFATSHGH